MIPSVRSCPCILLFVAHLLLLILKEDIICSAWSLNPPLLIPSRCSTRLMRRRTQHQRRPQSLHYQKEDSNSNSNSGADGITNNDNNINNNNMNVAPRLDTSFLKPHEQQIRQWLDGLEQVERSAPLWVGPNLLRLSPAEVLQESLEHMMIPPMTYMKLFPMGDPSTKYQFDWSWRYALMKLLSTEDEWNHLVSLQGISNTHPLRLQVVAIPAHTTLLPHVHPAVELAIPLLGTLYEDRVPLPETQSTQLLLDYLEDNDNNTNGSAAVLVGGGLLLVDPDLIDRAPEHSLGTPLSDFAEIPTSNELELIERDLSQRVSEAHELQEFSSVWEKGCEVRAGQCLVNRVGSVHRSYTKDEPCLLFVLGPNVHAHFIE